MNTTMRAFYTILVPYAFLLGTNCFASGAPNYLPDGPRPRIWLDAAKLTQLQAKASVDASGNPVGGPAAPEWTTFVNMVSPYKVAGSYYGMSAWHFSLAYVITKDTAYRDRALSLADSVILDMSSERADSGLYGYASMMDVALTYDWLYSELGATRKNSYIFYMVNFLNEWWNPAAPFYKAWAKENPSNNYYWHHMLATVLATIALFGDDNTPMTLITGGLTYSTPLAFWNAKMTQAIDKLTTSGKGGAWHEGIPYGQSSMEPMFMAWLAFRSATGRDYFNELAFPREAANYLLHAIQPDDTNYFPSGDLTRDPKGKLNQYYRSVMVLLSEGLEGSPESQYAQYWTESYYTTLTYNDIKPLNLLFRKAARTASNHKLALPLGYFATGYGWFNWRSSWNDVESVSLSFMSTDNFESHQHRNQNSFWIFYKDWQVSDANLYEPSGIKQTTFLENTYIIDGLGQYVPGGRGNTSAGRVLRQEFDSEHSYVKGDATAAYLTGQRDDGTPILNAYYRSILSTGKYTIVYDRVSPKTTSAVTDYYLHFSSVPSLSGTTATATNGPGMMFHKTLYPAVNLTAGTDSTYATNATGGYLKVTPQIQQADNYILNAIEVASSGTSTQTLTTAIHGVGLRGALIADATKNQVVMFSATSTEVAGGDYTATTTTASRHYISDLTPGAVFDINIDGSHFLSKTTSNAGVLNFDFAAIGTHTYSIIPLGGDSTPPVVTDFALPTTSSVLSVPVTSFSASDNIAITGYIITESTTAPTAGAAGWSATAPTSFIFSGGGSRTAYAWAKDAAGNVSASASRNVTITLSDVTAPSVSISSPVSGSTARGTVNVAVTATDNVAVTKVELYVNGTLFGTDSSAPYSFSWDSGTYLNGTYALTTKAYDAANNVQTSSPVSIIVNRKPKAPGNLR